MTKDAPAFDFYPERWLVGVAGMSDAEQLAYLRLLCHQWLLQGLPADQPALKRLGGKGVTEAVLAKLPLCDDGKRRNARLETIRQEQRDRIAKRREGAAKTNAKRWGNDIASDSLSDRLATRERLAQPVAIESPPPTTHPNKRESNAGAWPGLDEVKAYAPTVMALPECAESFWNGMEACGWVNKFGQPVNDWKPLFRNFATSWKSNEAQRKSHATSRQTPPRSDTANAPGRYS